MRPALVIAGSAIIAFLVFLLLPGGVAAAIGFELLVIVVAWMAIRRVVPRGDPAGTTGLPFVPFWKRSRWEPGPMLPVSLRRVERLMRYAERHPYAVHQRLLPELRALAAERLEMVHGVDMQVEPDRAAALLGGEAWKVIGPDSVESPERATQGISHDDIASAVTAIENVGSAS